MSCVGSRLSQRVVESDLRSWCEALAVYHSNKCLVSQVDGNMVYRHQYCWRSFPESTELKLGIPEPDRFMQVMSVHRMDGV